MIQGVFGRIENGRVVGWAFESDSKEPVKIKVKHGNKLLASGTANIKRPDLEQLTKSEGGQVGFNIKLPQGRKSWHKIEVYANGIQISKSPHLQHKIELTRRNTNPLEMEDPVFFVHIPKTAGTSFKHLLEQQFKQEEIFPSKEIVSNNNGQYPSFPELIKWEETPPKSAKVLLGHYPYATFRILKGKSRQIVILRDPIQRAISNIYHMKNNDPKLKDKTVEEIYASGKWHFRNLQVRYLTDAFIHPNMRYIDAKPLGIQQLNRAVKNLDACAVVGISESLEQTVNLANKVFNWELETPKKINIARTKKHISTALMKQIQKDNALEIKLYQHATKVFSKLCTKYAI